MSYEKDFQKFLSLTNEKEVLLEKIKEKIKERKVSSLLDIGAGDGLLSLPLSNEVKRYLAIEESDYFTEELERKGLKVKKGSFPLDIEDTFDMVLVSHSHPDSGYEQFISSAYNLLALNGCLLLITYKDRDSEWVNLLREVGEEGVEMERVGYQELSKYMQTLGRVNIEKEISIVTAPTAEELFNALSFVFSDGDEEKKERFSLHKERLCAIFKLRYNTGKVFSFPFQHFFISLVDF